CRILLDVSASMSYRSGAVSKLQYGSYLAAALAWLMNRQHDAVGLLTFDEWVVTNVPVSARPGHLRRILVALEQIGAGRRSDVSQALNALAAAMRRRGMVVLISDLLDDPEAVVAGLRHVKFRGSEVIVFHVLDPAELQFPFERATRFQDLETGREVTTVAGEIRDGYVREMDRMTARYRRELRLAGIEYCQVQTVQPLDGALREYLATRSRH
ncbi:MAG: VWA domain-containing protein, partial [Acidobacteria bacterium]|nr:VWA domain-containing protein [Acidobacteriota bacterium]